MNSRHLFICTTCGAAYDHELYGLCKICTDDRQYVLEAGQSWSCLDKMQSRFSISVDILTDSIFSLKVVPQFAIGQRALLVMSPSGNILWDCLPFIDQSTIDFIDSKGGIKGIAISHPHFYGLMEEYAAIFDCPVFLHASDQQWIMSARSTAITLWEGIELELWDNIKIINTGGHFPGSCILSHPRFGDSGTLLTSDSIYVSRDRNQVTCMHSYPNLIPLSADAVQKIIDRVMPLKFDRIYGGFDFMNIESNAKSIFERSMKNYLEIVDG